MHAFLLLSKVVGIRELLRLKYGWPQAKHSEPSSASLNNNRNMEEIQFGASILPSVAVVLHAGDVGSVLAGP